MALNVTICVPVYSVERYIGRCARSLLDQTYQDVEYIFVDDCSPDNSIGILKDVINEYPNRASHVRIICHDINRGLAAARNTAVSNCTTEWILHVDSDDWLAPNAIELLVKKQIETNTDIVTGQVLRIHTEKELVMERPQFKNHDDFVRDMIEPSFNHTIWGRLIRKSLYSDYNIQAKEGINIGEDMQVMVQLAYYATKVESVWDVVYYYDCTNDNSLMNTYKEKSINKLTQDIGSMEFVHGFFNNIETKFYDIAEKHLCDYYIKMLYHYCENADKNNYYIILRKLLSLKRDNRRMSISRYLKIRYYCIYRLYQFLGEVYSRLKRIV